MIKCSAIAQLRHRYAPNVNGVQVVGGSNPLTPIFVLVAVKRYPYPYSRGITSPHLGHFMVVR
jgi:hypothetical protein